MDKIILTKRQSEAVELLIKESDLEGAIDLVVTKGGRDRDWQRKELSSLNELSYKEILRALYVGYETEETNEERLFTLFKEAQEKSMLEDEDNYGYGYCSGIKETLKILNIKIKGINE